MEDLEFNEILVEKRHEELISTLQEISKKLSQEEESEEPSLLPEIKNILLKLEKNIMSLKPEKDHKLAEELKKLSSVLQSDSEQKSSNNWTFQIYRNPQGFIESVSAIKK